MIQTSYFARYSKSGNTNGVSIARGNRWWSGEKYYDLAPSPELLKIELPKEQWAKMFHQECLSKRDPKKVFQDLDGKVMLCYESLNQEKNPGQWCHRQIVAEWLSKELGIEVTEWFPSDKPVQKPKENPQQENVLMTEKKNFNINISLGPGYAQKLSKILLEHGINRYEWIYRKIDDDFEKLEEIV